MEPLQNLQKIRLEKLKKLKKIGVNPYPSSVDRSHEILKLKNLKLGTKVSIVGRISAVRTHGALTFADIGDASGKVQVLFSKDKLGPNPYSLVPYLDLGDFLGVEGKLIKTQAGELTVEATSLTILAKSLRPLPSRWHGLKDVEARYRQRYIDLILNPEVKEIFAKKTTFWTNMRKFLVDNGFFEVETPILEAIPGGADAKPFITHHNVLKIDLYLRISLELHLKRLIVGGYEKVFEIGRVFRNEGIDLEHLQDYTQMEFYWAYANYEDLLGFVQKMCQEIIKKTFGTLTTTRRGKKIDWGGTWPQVEYAEIFKSEAGIDLLKDPPIALLRKKAQDLGLSPQSYLGKGRLIDLIHKKTVRPKFVNPTFLIHHPVEVSPLAKRLAKNPKVTERIQIMAGGTELGNGWSELNDPIEQKERFLEQAKLHAAGDEEAQMTDLDFVRALEYGMPPTAGFGLSERLFAFLVDKPMREVVFFPTLKPERIEI